MMCFTNSLNVETLLILKLNYIIEKNLKKIIGTSVEHFLLFIHHIITIFI